MRRNNIWTLALALVASGCIGWLLAGGQQTELEAYNSTGNTVILAQGDRLYIVNTETQVIAVYDTSKKRQFLGGRRYDFDMELVRLVGEVELNTGNGVAVNESIKAIDSHNNRRKKNRKKS